MKPFNFDQFFVLDMANNHQGDVEHGLRIIREHGEVVRKHNIHAGLKFQFRQLDSFIHPDHKTTTTNKHIPRFLSTRLREEDYARLTEGVRESGMATICTPFDEESVDVIEKLGIEVIKIASCSAADRPLLERVAEAKLPVIASTAGLSIPQIDFLTAFFEDRGLNFAIMHCVAIYPTPPAQLRLNQIDLLKSRYRGVPIGFSTHEDPDSLFPVQMAVAKGAKMFERHVGVATETIKLNAYSSTPAQLDLWLGAYGIARAACGGEERAPAPEVEIESLRSLARSVFARTAIKAGQELTRENVFFAMPVVEGALTTNQWVGGIVADRDYSVNEALSGELRSEENEQDRILRDILIQTKGILSEARVPIGKGSHIELSHHYGLERFREFGAIIVTCVNRAYTKKLVIQLPRQKHPYHHHKIKEETFQLLYGDMEAEIDGHRTKLEVGDTILVSPGAWHKFHTLDGCIFEEVSTTHINNDSFYEDERIARLTREERKTEIPNWEKALRELI